ncbi:Uncharacterized protein GBIM_16672 [Gryllus bimaculatus]|nr:Uncharacterized protein GBIM_16672 [Gryllus bimaculatus]
MHAASEKPRAGAGGPPPFRGGVLYCDHSCSLCGRAGGFLPRVAGAGSPASLVSYPALLLLLQVTSSASNGVIPDVEEIWDEELLKQLLESCSDYEGRRKIRARLRTVMAEQSACASVVAAARADEEAARRGSVPATGSGSSTLVSHEETERGADGSSVHRTIQQGESLLLPLLVEQLRSSLRGGDSPAHHHHHPHARASRAARPGPRRASAWPRPARTTRAPSPANDLRLLAAGLPRPSRLQRAPSRRKLRPRPGAPPPRRPPARALRRPAVEVKRALARLAGVAAPGRGAGEVALDAERRERAPAAGGSACRRRSSLPPAPPGPAPSRQGGHPRACGVPAAPRDAFAKTRRAARAARHTVGVDARELAARRRLLDRAGAAERGGLARPARQNPAPAHRRHAPRASAYAGLVACPVRQAAPPGELAHRPAGLGGRGGSPRPQRASASVRFTPAGSKSASQARSAPARRPRRPPPPPPAAPAPARNDPWPSAADPRARPLGPAPTREPAGLAQR